MTLAEILSQSSLNNLNDIKAQEEAIREKEAQQIHRKNIERWKKTRFTSRQELIEYVKAGNKLLEEGDNGYMFYIPERDEVGHYSMQYDKFSDMPMGMGTTYKSWENFVKWTAWMDDDARLNDGFIPYWNRELKEE